MTPEEIEKIKKLKVYQLMPTTASKDVEWINWMKQLDKDFDRDTAVSIFIKLWERRGTADARTSLLRSFMKDKYKVDLAEGAIDKIVDLGGDVTDVFAGIFKTGKVIALVVGGVLFLGLIGIIYSVVKNPSSVMMLTPGGRAAKAAGGAKL